MFKNKVLRYTIFMTKSLQYLMRALKHGSDYRHYVCLYVCVRVFLCVRVSSITVCMLYVRAFNLFE